MHWCLRKISWSNLGQAIMPALGQALLVIITALGQALLVIITALGRALLVIMPALFSNILIMPAQLVRHSMKNARPLLIVKSEFQVDNE